MHEGTILFRKRPQYVHCPAAKPNFDAPAEQFALAWIKPKWAERYNVALLFHTVPSSTGVAPIRET